MSVKKLSFYIDDTDITLRSHYLPLRRFLDNVAVELEQCKIKFKHIKGINNTLANAMSRLVELETDICQYPEP